MKLILKLFLLLLLNLTTTLNIEANYYEFTYDGINYEVIHIEHINDPIYWEVEVGRNPNFSGIANIASSVTFQLQGHEYTMSVTRISGYAFEDCTGLTSITIPNTVTYIEDGAFEGCNNLTSIAIPNSVYYIGSVAFQYCTGLLNVTIPNSVFRVL